MDVFLLALDQGDWTLTLAGCALIILFALVFGFCQHLQIASIKKSLRAGIGILRNADPTDPAMWSKVSLEIGAIDLFKDIEPSYSSGILPQDSVSETNQRDGFAIYSLQAPAHFFNEDSLYLAHINAQFFNALPNILTGLGIFFTFIGLCFGLSSVNTSTAQDLVQSITPLLNGASLAFGTSIAGLFCSILYTFYNNSVRHQVSLLINEFNLSLQQRVCVLTVEDCFHDMQSQLKQQTVIMNTFAADWQMQIKDILTEVFTAQAQANEKETTRVVGAIDTVTESLNNIGRLQSEQIASLLDESLQNFSVKLTQAIEGMSATFAETAHSVSETVSLLDTTLAKMQETVVSMGEATATAVSQISASTATTQEHIESSAQSVTQSTDIVCEKLTALSKDMQTHIDAFTQKAVQAGDLFSEATNQAGTHFSEKTTSAADYLSQGTIKASDHFSETVTQVAEEFKATSQIFRNSVALSSDTFRQNITSAGETLKSILEPSIESAVTFTEKLKTIQKDIDNVRNSYSEAISNVTSLGEQLQTTADQLGKRMEGSMTAAGQIQQKLSDQLGETAKALLSEIQDMTRVQTDLTRNSEQLQNLMDESLTSLAESMKTMNDQLKNNLNEADQDLAKSVSILSESYDGLREHLQTVFNDLKTEVEEIRNENKRLTRYREEVTQLIKSAQANKDQKGFFS